MPTLLADVVSKVTRHALLRRLALPLIRYPCHHRNAAHGNRYAARRLSTPAPCVYALRIDISHVYRFPSGIGMLGARIPTKHIPSKPSIRNRYGAASPKAWRSLPLRTCATVITTLRTYIVAHFRALCNRPESCDSSPTASLQSNTLSTRCQYPVAHALAL